jgi:GDP-4-dehydro-6-deoxy-D-mannose reductase
VRVAVSGVSGFVGAHLTHELVAHGHEVIGLGKGPATAVVGDVLLDYKDQDLADLWPSVTADAVVHLAGLSAVGPSFADPQGYIQGNSAPVTHLCEGLLREGRSPRIIVVSTGALYAPGVGVTEGSPTQPSSPYAVSKLLVETQCAYYRRRGLDITTMRPFNHIGPGQQPGFLLPDLIAGVASGSCTVGDLATRRDYTDVRDVARAYRLAVEAAPSDVPVLNVCSAVSVSGHRMLELVAHELGVSVPEVTVDPALLRPDDPPEIRGDNALIARELGWRPTIALETSVRDTVADLTTGASGLNAAAERRGPAPTT